MLKVFTGLGVQKCKQALDRLAYLSLVSKAYYTASTDIIIELLQDLSTVLSISLRPQVKSGKKVDREASQCACMCLHEGKKCTHFSLS